jgi:Ni/Co efflux regulator RcnB
MEVYMKKLAIAALAAATAITGSMSAGVAAAQPDHHWDRDHRGDHRGDRWERPRNWDRWYSHDRWSHGVRYYGGNHGYNGYHGRWRTGQRYPYYRDNRYVIEDYRAYRLPPPRAGYRYYRDDNGDIVMAAIASGVIGLIIGSQIN